MVEPKEETQRTKIKNIVDMAVSFSAMGRIFEEGATRTIQKKLYTGIKDFLNVKNSNELQKKHHKFCEWFVSSIKTALPELQPKSTKR